MGTLKLMSFLLIVFTFRSRLYDIMIDHQIISCVRSAAFSQPQEIMKRGKIRLLRGRNGTPDRWSDDLIWLHSSQFLHLVFTSARSQSSRLGSFGGKTSCLGESNLYGGVAETSPISTKV